MSAIADAVRWAEEIMKAIDERWPRTVRVGRDKTLTRRRGNANSAPDSQRLVNIAASVRMGKMPSVRI